jgi:hypothetical protein
MHRAWIVAATLLASCGGWQSGPCSDMCHELADRCDYAAYPSFSSCYDGCVYSQSERGADITAQNECVQAADCDTFAIVECEHANGAQ